MKPIAIVGCVLIAAGILQIFVQMVLHRRRVRQSERPNTPQKMHVGKFEVQSAYPGSTMIGIGAVLLLAAEFGTTP